MLVVEDGALACAGVLEVAFAGVVTTETLIVGADVVLELDVAAGVENAGNAFFGALAGVAEEADCAGADDAELCDVLLLLEEKNDDKKPLPPLDFAEPPPLPAALPLPAFLASTVVEMLIRITSSNRIIFIRTPLKTMMR